MHCILIIAEYNNNCQKGKPSKAGEYLEISELYITLGGNYNVWTYTF